MKAISSTETPFLSFDLKKDEMSKKTKMATNKIGWIHSFSDKPGAKFDIIIKDALGRVKLRKINCGNETTKYGELINLPGMIGEEIEVVLENVKGAEKLDLFIN